MTLASATAYWVTAPGIGELRAEPVPQPPPPGKSLVRALFGAVSPGTERLVGLRQVPADCTAAMACRSMAGDFQLPVKYGYCLVGMGVAGACAKQLVFVMHPHQDLATVEDDHVVALPMTIPPWRATLLPNLETAVNGVWDADLTSGERPLVVGGGAVGLLVAHALHRLHGIRPDLVEADDQRAKLAAALPFVGAVLAPAQTVRGDYQVAFHATGTGAGLQLALDAVGFEGRVIELSWHGTKPVALDLGSTFHFQRKRIQSSQVATVAPSHRGHHGARVRFAAALALLDEPALDGLLGEPIPFARLPELMARVYTSQPTAPVPVIRYGEGT